MSSKPKLAKRFLLRKPMDFGVCDTIEVFIIKKSKKASYYILQSKYVNSRGHYDTWTVYKEQFDNWLATEILVPLNDEARELVPVKLNIQAKYIL